jgi:hypothetical protein
MPSYISRGDHVLLKNVLNGIDSHLNFVDEAEDRSNGLVSIREYDLQVWSERIHGILDLDDYRRNEHLETVPEHYRGDGFITCDMALAAMLAKATRMAMPPMVIFWWANAFKYLWRWAYKGDCKGDLNKAIDCIEHVRDWQKTR